MTVKKRLVISNILMILVPVCMTLVIASGCLGIIWYTVAHGTGLGFEDSEDFFQASRGISELVAESLRTEPKEREPHLKELSSLLDDSAMSLAVTWNGTDFYTYGETFAEDDALLRAVNAMEGEGLVSQGERSLYAHREDIGGDTYGIFLFSSQRQSSYRTLKVVLVLTGLILAAAILLSIWLTNRFLTRFVFRRIEEPLDILAVGVQKIGSGDLDYRIQYDGRDEFTPVCVQFNEMAERLKQSVEETRRHEESRKELMAGISHDLRSPLTSIQAYVEGLLDGVARTPEKQREYLLTVKAKAEDIQRMVSQIFLYSKMDLDDYPVAPKPLRLDEEVSTLVENTAGEYAGKGLQVTMEGLWPPVTVNADPAELRRVLTNILDNSAKYKTEETGHLTIRLEERPEAAVLTLADDGPGVPADALPKLFDVFYRSDPARQHPGRGSGLGLAIAAKSIHRMGGTIEAQNAVPHGLSISITLPKEN